MGIKVYADYSLAYVGNTCVSLKENDNIFKVINLPGPSDPC